MKQLRNTLIILFWLLIPFILIIGINKLHNEKKLNNYDVTHDFIRNKLKNIESSTDYVLLIEYNNCLFRNLNNYHSNSFLSDDQEFKMEDFIRNDDKLFESCMVHQAQWLRANDKDKYDFIKKVFKEKNLIVPEDGISKDIIEILSSK